MLNVFYFLGRNINKLIDYIDSIGKKLGDYEIVVYNPKKRNIVDGDNVRHIFLYIMPDGIKNIIPQNKLFLLNTEQFTREYKDDCIDKFIDRGCYNIIDYSEENIQLFKKHDVENKLNYYHLPYQVNFDEIYNFEKTNDACILFLGYKRRRNLYDKLIKNGVKVDVLDGYGKERDNKLFTYKLIINTHASKTHNINEQIRINRCIFNKMIVISEYSEHWENLILKDYIIFCKIEDMPKKIKEVLCNYEQYYSNIFGKFNLNLMEECFNKYIVDFSNKNS